MMADSRRIIIDADACPQKVRAICAEKAASFGWELLTVASFAHNIPGGNHYIVGNDPQAADLAILNLCRKADLVVTQDWGLAAMVLGKGAQAVSPNGYLFQPEKIDFLLEERNIKAKYRRGGGRTKGPRPRTRGDDENFERILESVLNQLDKDPVP